MFRQLLLTLAILLCSTSLFAQKIKIKKGEILVDKVPAFKFEKTSGKGEAYAYAMTTLEGEPMLTFSNRKLEYVQLPYEESARLETKYCFVEAPALGGKTTNIYPIGPAYGNRFGYDAKKTGFLTATGLDAEKWQAYLDYSDAQDFTKKFANVEAANAVRAENSVKSMAEYGEFPVRENGRVYRLEGNIKIKDVIIAHVQKTTPEDAKLHARKGLMFYIRNMSGEKVIASIYVTKGSRKYWIRTSIDTKEHEFTISTPITGETIDTYQKGLDFLVNFGYL